MDEITAKWAARQLGELLQERVHIAAAIIEGEYHVAERLVDNAIAQSDELRERLAMVERRERQPHDAVARALRTDKQLIDRLLGNRPPGYGESTQYTGLPSSEYPLESFAAMRECEHGRPSWDGYCVAQPPCPLS
jgi:hypothetical protein